MAKRGPKLKRPNCSKDWKDFDGLCKLQCTLKEIAGFFEVSEDTIERRVESEKEMKFADYYNQASAGGKISLRRHQYKTAMDGNASLLIWLGKQWLGQKDSIKVSGDEDSPIKLAYDIRPTSKK